MGAERERPPRGEGFEKEKVDKKFQYLVCFYNFEKRVKTNHFHQ